MSMTNTVNDSAGSATEHVAARSLRLRLALWLSSFIVGVAVVAGAYAFWQTFEEVHELQDDVLRQVAALVRHTDGANLQALQNATEHDDLDIDDDTQVLVQALGQHGKRKKLELPESLPDGLQTFTHGHTSYRMLVHSLPSGERFVADAAHELRSPMTALSLQAQRLAGAEMSDAAHERLQALQAPSPQAPRGMSCTVTPCSPSMRMNIR